MYTGTHRAAILGDTGRGNYGHGLDLAAWERLSPPPETDTVAGAAPPPPGAGAFFVSNRAIAADLLESIETGRPP